MKMRRSGFLGIFSFESFDDLAKKAPELWFRKKLQMQGAQKLRSETGPWLRLWDHFFLTIEDVTP